MSIHIFIEWSRLRGDAGGAAGADGVRGDDIASDPNLLRLRHPVPHASLPRQHARPPQGEDAPRAEVLQSARAPRQHLRGAHSPLRVPGGGFKPRRPRPCLAPF
eukprot:6528333-Pyramimonas_sp.AAC.1